MIQALPTGSHCTIVFCICHNPWKEYLGNPKYTSIDHSLCLSLRFGFELEKSNPGDYFVAKCSPFYYHGAYLEDLNLIDSFGRHRKWSMMMPVGCRQSVPFVPGEARLIVPSVLLCFFVPINGNQRKDLRDEAHRVPNIVWGRICTFQETKKLETTDTNGRRWCTHLWSLAGLTTSMYILLRVVS